MAISNQRENKMKDIALDFTKISPKVLHFKDDYQHYHSFNDYNSQIKECFSSVIWKKSLLDKWYWKILKRMLDVIISFFLFVFLFSFLWPIIIIAIKITTKESAFYKQERWGKNGKKFILYKFRTLKQGCKQFDENGNFLQVTRNDQRVTTVGRFLRRTNLDELPQFINILKGEMSIIGPRPHITIMDIHFRPGIEDYMQRYSVKPGITGWAQVNGLRGETKDPDFMKKRVEHDLWYIENWSFGLDLQIILKTAWNMIKGDPNAY